ncbi:MAG: SDR family oxidoreductase [Granulosicoccus sp.]|nr:SDR family oxidoreductase [Granulosicoccus sp.]
MAKLVVIGGSSGVGLACVKEALSRGHEVTMFSRTASRSGLSHQNLEIIEGDALDKTDVTRSLRGSDAVIQTLGVTFDLKMITGPITLFSESTTVLLDAMNSEGIARLIALTGFGAGDSNSAVSMLQRPGFNLVFGEAYTDKSRQERMIKASTLDWTIARPGVLRNGAKTGKYRVLIDPNSWRNGVIRRADVADFMVGAAESNGYVRQAPVLISHGFLPFT